jgi:hypothetical protein
VRPLAFIALCVASGLATAYASAVLLGSFVWVGQSTTTADYVDPSTRPPNGRYCVWICQHEHAPGVSRITSTWFDEGTVAYNGPIGDGAPWRLVPSWAPSLHPAHHSPSSSQVHSAIAVASGWPMYAVQASAYCASPPFTYAPVPSTLVELQGGALRRAPRVLSGGQFWPQGALIPLRPSPIGLAVNALVFAAVIALALRLGRLALRAHRRRRLRCPFCGYSRRLLPTDRCPECGDGQAA